MTITLQQAREYLFEIQREAELVERLFVRFQTAADKWLAADVIEQPDGRVLWSSIEAEEDMLIALEGILSGYARVSLFFFPESQAGAFGRSRATYLRNLAKIPDDHLIGNRTLRNHWTHLDERLDRLVQETGNVPVGTALDKRHRLTREAQDSIFRLIDPSNESVFILGARFDLREMTGAVRHVGVQAALAIVER